jgi:hypothetical protein
MTRWADDQDEVGSAANKVGPLNKGLHQQTLRSCGCSVYLQLHLMKAVGTCVCRLLLSCCTCVLMLFIAVTDCTSQINCSADAALLLQSGMFGVSIVVGSERHGQ